MSKSKVFTVSENTIYYQDNCYIKTSVLTDAIENKIECAAEQEIQDSNEIKFYNDMLDIIINEM